MGRITPSKEDYLETILDLAPEGGSVKSIDVAAALGYSRASISRAMSQLRADGYIAQEPYGQVTLTAPGLAKARAVRRRHDLLNYFLRHILEVDPATAEADACRMEHVVSGITLQKIEEMSQKHRKEFHKGETLEVRD